MNYFEYYRLSWQHLTVQGKSIGNQQSQLTIAHATFHPAITFTGLQPCIILQARNGTLLKFNSNKDIYKGHTYAQAIHRIINAKILAPVDVPPPGEYKSLFEAGQYYYFFSFLLEIKIFFLEQKKQDPLKANTQKALVVREFFIAHKSTVISVVFMPQSATNFITIDTEGRICVWEYSADNFSDDSKSFTPTKSFVVKLEGL